MEISMSFAPRSGRIDVFAALFAVVLAAPGLAQSYVGAGGLIPSSGTGGGTYPTTPDPTGWFSSQVTVTVPVTTVSKISLRDWNHTWVGDEQIVLVDPAGVGHNIMVRPGYDSAGAFGNSGDRTNGDYAFVKPGSGVPVPHTAATPMPAATYSQDFGDPAGLPPGGTWVPGTMINTTVVNNTPMDQISGPAGVWELFIYDWAAVDSGALADWTLHVNGAGGPPPVTYCTAKTNSLGCIPAIGWSGAPSAAAQSGFAIIAYNERNNKNGLLFYGTTGQSSVAFQGGTLCVASPIRRTPSVFSGGALAPANNCSGIFAIDMNSFASGQLGGTPSPALTVPGTTVDCQWWGRDPGFPAPNNTTLSNGVEYVVAP
jgi:hypothetical protein